MASTHPAIVVGNSDEVIAARPCVWIDEELGHVQVSAEEDTSERVKKPCGKLLEYNIIAMLSAEFK